MEIFREAKDNLKNTGIIDIINDFNSYDSVNDLFMGGIVTTLLYYYGETFLDLKYYL